MLLASQVGIPKQRAKVPDHARGTALLETANAEQKEKQT